MYFTCALMDLSVPGHNINLKGLDKLCLTEDSVVGETMKLAPEDVLRRLDLVPGAMRCNVSFDASASV